VKEEIIRERIGGWGILKLMFSRRSGGKADLGKLFVFLQINSYY